MSALACSRAIRIGSIAKEREINQVTCIFSRNSLDHNVG